jgi:tRNA A-37 threonylcarbamoyl transferase component Bud32
MPTESHAIDVALASPGSPGARSWFETQIREFEQATRGASGNIERFLRRIQSEAPPHVLHELLLELIAVELELRWRRRRGRRAGPKLEVYLKRFPQLKSLDELPLWLVAEEYRVRRRFGDAPQKAEYVARFPRHGSALAPSLAAVDDDLQSEGAATQAPQKQLIEFPAEPVDPQAPLFHGDYLLRRLIGAGGTCKVYTGVQRSLDKPVAIKVLKKPLLNDRFAVERFLKEARIAARLRHPAIVAVHGLGRFPDGGYFMVLDLIEGQDLARKSAHGATLLEAALLTAQAADAIAFCHAAGVIHCDVKPGNLIADSRGVVHLSDFGLARLAADCLENASEAIAGTAAYMAPEQIDRRWGGVTEAADIYALGAVLYTLMTRRPPYLAADRDATLSLVAAPDVFPAAIGCADELGERLAKIALRCLAKDPARRFATAREVADALRQAASGFMA